MKDTQPKQLNIDKQALKEFSKFCIDYEVSGKSKKLMENIIHSFYDPETKQLDIKKLKKYV